MMKRKTRIQHKKSVTNEEKEEIDQMKNLGAASINECQLHLVTPNIFP